MARPRKSSPKTPVAGAAPALGGGASTPAPPATLHITRMTFHKGHALHRVHPQEYTAAEFNPGVVGNARFSPIRDAKGRPIPTIYAGTTYECAAMETVFHDVPHTAGFKSFDKNKLVGQTHSLIESIEDLKLADLGTIALRKLGVERKRLIDTEKDQYPMTRPWAKAIHDQFPDVQGLSWVSRQDDSARAFMFFGDRVAKGTLQQNGNSRNLVNDSDAYTALLVLADRIGVNIVPGK